MSTVALALRGAALATALIAVSANASLPTTTDTPAAITSGMLTPIAAAAAEQGPKKDDRSIQLARRGADDPELERYRWMLEELRVSLFAQELKTLFPVSVKRIEEQGAKVRV